MKEVEKTMALRKIISRTLNVGIVAVYVPIVAITTPLMVMNPVGIVTVIPSFLTFALIGQEHNSTIGLKAGALSLPILFFGYVEHENARRRK